MKDDAEVRKDSWSIERDFIYRDHIKPLLQLYVPKEETFSIPLMYIDVTSTTYTNLEVLHESRIADSWNVDADRIFQIHGQDSRSSRD